VTLDELVTQLRSAYGGVLRAVVLYGSAAAGEHIAKRSDYNVLVVVDDIPLDRLSALASVMRAWRDAGNPAPMTFTVREWENSADVFPMEYADILERNKVLFGADPFAGISVDPADLRLQTEREALSVLLRLRRGVLVTGNDPSEQLRLLDASLSSLMIVFRAVLRLHGRTPPQNNAEVVKDVAELTGVDPDPFYDVIHHVRGDRKIHKDRASAILGTYLRGMKAVTAHIDALPSTSNNEDR
jgi:predicted nucleotidyltransferase